MLRALLVGLAGFGLSLAFQPVGWWWLAVPCAAVLIAACRGGGAGRGFLLGLLFGMAFYVPLLWWLGAVIGRDAGIGLAIYSATWLGLTGLGIAVVGRLRLWWLWVPAVWVLVEAVSGRIPFGGWGWGRIGFSQAESPLLPWASVAGVPGLSFLVVLMAACLAAVVAALADGRPTRVLAPAATTAAVLVVAGLVPLPTQGQTTAGPAQRQVGVIQGNVPQAGLDFNESRRAVLDNHARQTIKLAQDVAAGRQRAPDFVVWPENASDIDPFRNADARAVIDASVRSIGVPVLVGAVVTDPQDPGYVRNQGIVWDPLTGPGASYTKRNLVPFGEYVPFRGLLAQYISRFDRVPRDFLPGAEPGGLDIDATRIGVAICFDVAYDDAFRDAVRDGGRMLVVQTNNATYNLTSQPYQQFEMSRIRAVEHGRAVVVVSTSGLSGVIAPDGTVVPGTTPEELEPARYTTDVAQRDALTVADRVGAGPELVLGLAGAGALLLGWRRGNVSGDTRGEGSQRRGGEQSPEDADVTGRHS